MRAQIAFEYLIVFFILGLLFTLFLQFFAAYQEDFRSQRNSVLVDEVGSQLQTELFSAASVREGYQREFTIPNNLEGAEYTVSTHDTFFVLRSKGSDYIFPMPKVTGSIQKGKNTIIKRGEVLCLNTAC